MYCLAIYSILVDSPSWAGQCLPTNWPEKKEEENSYLPRKKEVENSYLFCKKKYIFSILSTYFYKTPILIYLFYHLFYLNNNISLIFYYIKQTTIHMALLIFFLLCCEKKTDERTTWRGEKKRIKKIICTWIITVRIYMVTVHLQNIFIYLHIFTSTDVSIFWIKMYKIEHFLYFVNFCCHSCGCF